LIPAHKKKERMNDFWMGQLAGFILWATVLTVYYGGSFLLGR
jgi:hypothetical protein